MSNIDETVTVVVTRKVKGGRESQYEDWLERLKYRVCDID
jgi:antibiotic biosynthesis monooxygenase (ABM) superfamily enzyme